MIRAALSMGYTQMFGTSFGKLIQNEFVTQRWVAKGNINLDQFKRMVNRDFGTIQKERMAYITRSTINAVFSEEMSTRLAYTLGL